MLDFQPGTFSLVSCPRNATMFAYTRQSVCDSSEGYAAYMERQVNTIEQSNSSAYPFDEKISTIQIETYPANVRQL